VGNAGSRCGEPWTPGPSRRAPPRLFVDRSYVALCWPALLRRPLAVRSRLGPNVDGVAGRFKRSELTSHRRDACGLSNRCTKDTPFVAGVCLPTVANVGGSGIQATRDRWFSGERPCAHTGAVHGAGGVPVLPRVAPALAWTLNKYTPQREW